MDTLLQQFAPITLAEMQKVKLMQRTDTKYLTTPEKLHQLLAMAVNQYHVQEINGQRIAHYATLYFDTPDNNMYNMHQHGHVNRQKVRIRSYLDSQQHFLEVKTKDNHGKTNKQRITLKETPDTLHTTPQQFIIHPWTKQHCYPFLRQHLRYDPETLTAKMQNQFQRITLVNKQLTERLTIDTQLQFNLLNNQPTQQLQHIVVIELKRDVRQPSYATQLLRQQRIFPQPFSKYSLARAMTDNTVRVNRFKERLHNIKRLQQQANNPL
ncbi:MAG: polyphosphate polymerase domain-containing protein [Bacteroidaceae bacterium]|nr:polyphosphate polymerase domain-containing protein [Bacteroidaceae bacterium]